MTEQAALRNNVTTPTLLQLLVWEATPLRFLLELFTTLLVYYTIILNLPPHLRFNSTVNLALGISLIIITIFIDRSILCGSQRTLKKCFDSAVTGELQKAYAHLESVRQASVPPPSYVFDVKAAELCFMNGDISRADHHLSRARESGIRNFECELIRLKGALYSNHASLTSVNNSEQFTTQPLWIVENAMLSLFKDNDYNVTKKHIEAAKLLPNIMHSSSASTHDLCHLINLCVGLHSGKAEEYLPQLNFLLSFIKYQIITIPEIRPYLSFAFLERAKYYTKRQKNWDKAKSDIDTALSICRYPAHQESARLIRERMVG